MRDEPGARVDPLRSNSPPGERRSEDRRSAKAIEETARASHQTLSTVAILARDMVAGQALELLLQSAGYSTRLLLETIAGKLVDPLDGVHLLLLAPSLSARHREDFLNLVNSTPAMMGIPVLELVTSSNGAQAEPSDRVPWPCRMEDLQGKIEAALTSRDARRAV